jgi:catechol 2,3-dioxygenase-like lactoylglutathione lyase family enzyme
MIDHITFRVSEFERSARFYDRALAPLGLRRLSEDVGGDVKTIGYGDARPWLWIADGVPMSGPLHIALSAADRAVVDAFHREAMLAGGRDHGAPGPRPRYSRGYYAAFVLDPDGHNIEAVFRDPSVA